MSFLENRSLSVYIMVRLNEGTKHAIVALREAGLSWNKIPQQIKMNQSTERAVFAKKLVKIRKVVVDQQRCHRVEFAVLSE